MPEYVIQESIRFEGLETIALSGIVADCSHEWFNQSLCRIDQSVVRLGIFCGAFHFHSHEREDEFLLVLEGKLWIDLEDRTIELEKHQGVMIPKGVVHRPRAPEKAVVLMVEAATVRPTGDA